MPYLGGFPMSDQMYQQYLEMKRQKDAEDQRKKYYSGEQVIRRGIEGVEGRPAPQAAGTTIAPIAQMNTGRADEFRGQQTALAQQLGRVASGQQQGAGELAVQRQAARALGQAQGAATMARGAGAAGAARSAARAIGAIGLGAAGQAQEAALADQAAARQQMAGVLAQGREQDITTAAANMSAENQRIFQQAGLDQATSLANMQARLQAIGMNDQAIQGYLQALNQAQALEMEKKRAKNAMLGGLLTAAGTVGGAIIGGPAGAAAGGAAGQAIGSKV